MDTSRVPGAIGQVQVAGSQARLSELAVGQVYRVQVTDVLPGKAEILLGNQYLLAATPFKFQPGDMISLKLTAQNPELLTFQLVLPGQTIGDQQASTDMATLIRAAALPDTAANRAAVATLINSGVPVTSRSVAELGALINTVPVETAAAFMPLYKELIDRELNIQAPVLRQLAIICGGSPGLAGMLAESIDGLRSQRAGRDERRRRLDDAISAALTTVSEDKDLPTAQALKEQVRLLYSSPEHTLRRFLESLAAPDEDAAPDEIPAEAGAELYDLTNLSVGETVPAEFAAVLNLLQAQRIRSSVDPARRSLSLPMLLDGEPTDVNISLQLLAEQYYQKDYAMRIRVDNGTQGKVEFQVKTRGPGLGLTVLVDDEEVLPFYQEALSDLTADLNDGTGFFVRSAKVSRQNL